MSISLHPPRSVTDAYLPELLSFFCCWKDGREKGRKCGQGVSVGDMPPHKLKNYAIFKLFSCDLVYTFCQLNVLKVNQFIKNRYLLWSYLSLAPDARTIIDGREKGVRPGKSEGDALFNLNLAYTFCQHFIVRKITNKKTETEQNKTKTNKKKRPDLFQSSYCGNTVWGTRAL